MTERWLVTYSYICNLLTPSGGIDKLSESVGYKIILEHPAVWLAGEVKGYFEWRQKYRQGELIYCSDNSSDIYDDIRYIVSAIPVPDDADVDILPNDKE